MKNQMEKKIQAILEDIEPDSYLRLENTPKRAALAFEEFFSGYTYDVEKVAEATYTSSMDDIIILKNIQFESYCEHHILPVVGNVAIGYVPNGKIIGASKLARIVDCFARRLQLQERMTMEIADAIAKILSPHGVAVYVDAEHFCISHRGVKKRGSRFVTKYFLGVLKDNYQLRSEFISECIK